ncbi:MAG: signal peptidase I [Pseudomonadales bacterium]
MEYINFPLILVLLVFGSLFIWLYDIAFLSKKRQQAIANLRSDLPAWEQAGSNDNQRYIEALTTDHKEPVAVEYARSLFPVLALVLILRSFVIEPFQIPSRSMVPTLEVGDFILVNKFTYGLRLPVIRNKVWDNNDPQRGDVMVFFPPHKKQYFIKRVIGLPGDYIEYRNKTLFINGEEMRQNLVAELPPGQPTTRLTTEQIGAIEHSVLQHLQRFNADNFSVKVKPNHYFMMGDNRDNSQDSRVWGQVPEGNIVGKAFAIWMHWEKFTSLPSFKRVGVIE